MGAKQAKTSFKTDLTEAEISALVTATKMTKHEIMKWYKGFMKDCPNGRLTKIQFVKIYEELFPTHRAQRFCDLVFKVFDKKRSNSIDFREFIIACSLTRAKAIDGIVLSLDVYNPDANCLLTTEELEQMIEAVHELFEGAPISKVNSKKKVDVILQQYKRTHHDSITKDQFIEALNADPEIAAFLSLYTQNGM